MEQARVILNTLQEAGFSAYIVGGAVRDFLIGEPCNDVDIATSATPFEVMTLFPKVIPTGLDFGTVTIMVGKVGYEVTTYRKDGRYEDGRRPTSVAYSDSIIEDLSRRDFTINAMAMSLDGTIVDPFNGQQDFANKVLRTVGNAHDRFSEDALRMIRAARFAARFDLTLDSELVLASQDLSSTTLKLSGERVFQELVKMLQYGSKGIELLQEMGILQYILPEVHSMVGVEQDNPHHHLDVFSHTMKTIDASPVDDVIRLTMLFHDTGKPSSKVFDGIKDVFIGHPQVSADMTISAFKRLKASRKLTDTVVQLVLLHDTEVSRIPKSVRKLRSKLTDATIEQWLCVRRADIAGQHPDTHEEKLLHLDSIQTLSETPDTAPFTVKDLAINGYTLLVMGLSGPEIGQTLSRLLEEVMSDPKLNTRVALVSMVQLWSQSNEEEGL